MLGLFRKNSKEKSTVSVESERIKETVQTYLQGCGRTSRELSDLTGFSEGGIENWKSGKSRITLENALIVAESLSIDIGMSDYEQNI